MKIYPLTTGDIKQLVFDHCAGEHAVNYACQWCRLILSWAHERARGRWYFHLAENHSGCEYECNSSCGLNKEATIEFYKDLILDEIQWPKEQR